VVSMDRSAKVDIAGAYFYCSLCPFLDVKSLKTCAGGGKIEIFPLDAAFLKLEFVVHNRSGLESGVDIRNSVGNGLNFLKFSSYVCRYPKYLKKNNFHS